MGLFVGLIVLAAGAAGALRAEPPGKVASLPGTAPLTMEGDIASTMIDGIDKFLLRETELSLKRRAAHWQRDTSSAAAYEKSVAPNRQRFRRIIGLRDERIADGRLQLMSSVAGRAQPLAKGDGYDIFAARWPVLEGVDGEGLIAMPKRITLAIAVCLPDASQSPEALFGLAPGVPAESQFARRLAEQGFTVIVPQLIDRDTRLSATMNGARKLDITHREFLYRPSFELGRHIIGYEVQKVLALVDEFRVRYKMPTAVVGHGEGGLLSLYAGAADPRIDLVGVNGYFDSRQDLWREPLDRNVFGLLDEFGDAELASLIAPRPLMIEACAVPEVTIPPGTHGGPGRTVTPPLSRVEAEVERARQLTAGLEPKPSLQLVVSGEGRGPMGSDPWLQRIVAGMTNGGVDQLVPSRETPRWIDMTDDEAQAAARARLERQFRQIERHAQRLLVESPYVRAEFMAKADRASRDPAKFAESMKPYREQFRHDVIGECPYELSKPNPRSRKFQQTEKYTIHEVVLDVLPDVIAYGLYIVPEGIKPGEKRPVVVCQHGLEGRPQDTIGEAGFPYYKAFATALAKRGFITFAPQNIYIFKDRFRTLQRKANPLKKTLFSIMVPQHEQIVRWLASRPEVDPERIGFYGLSYGGKSAMRIPALVDGYALSICSADFNEWVWKNASTRSRYTYVGTGEYEIFEFDLGSTFNYAEMAALICPRPFMVERGHHDGVAPDEEVAYEYAKIRLLYSDLGIPERTEIEFFDGPHTIHGVGTFAFLHKHLRWPVPEQTGGK